MEQVKKEVVTTFSSMIFECFTQKLATCSMIDLVNHLALIDPEFKEKMFVPCYERAKGYEWKKDDWLLLRFEAMKVIAGEQRKDEKPSSPFPEFTGKLSHKIVLLSKHCLQARIRGDPSYLNAAMKFLCSYLV